MERKAKRVMAAGWLPAGVLLSMITLAGCDPGSGSYSRCQSLKDKDPMAALVACRDAVVKAPDKTSGKKAALLLPEISYSLCVAQKDTNPAAAVAACRDAVEKGADKDAGKKAALLLPEISRVAEKLRLETEARNAATRAARLEYLRQRVRRKYFDTEEDGTCTGRGLPPFRWLYKGGTYDEDAELAAADGCVPRSNIPNLPEYCCPERPSAW